MASCTVPQCPASSPIFSTARWLCSKHILCFVLLLALSRMAVPEESFWDLVFTWFHGQAHVVFSSVAFDRVLGSTKYDFVGWCLWSVFFSGIGQRAGLGSCWGRTAGFLVSSKWSVQCLSQLRTFVSGLQEIENVHCQKTAWILKHFVPKQIYLWIPFLCELFEVPLCFAISPDLL